MVARSALVCSAVLLLLAWATTAQASPFRRLAADISGFATDGTRYAAWQVTSTSIVFYDSRTGRRRLVTDHCGLLEPPDRRPYEAAAAGLFLDGCRHLINARTGRKTSLSSAARYPVWSDVGRRYVMGWAGQRGHCGVAGPCEALYNIASDAVTEVPRADVPDLDAPGAPSVCSALRKKITYFEPRAFENFSYSAGVLARAGSPATEGFGHEVLLQRCDGHSTVVHTFREPSHLELRGGVLTWDSAHELVDAETLGEGIENFSGVVSSYTLGTHRRHSWQLPHVHIFTDEMGAPPIVSEGAFGYTAHTNYDVFWIAGRSYGCDIYGSCRLITWRVYAAHL